ncbi:Carboxylesterase [bioreactor metagenome]|uniref:Carboxylesterase n=1 Tax=bioreactor metagenome TaxID=1076179 RepID=A0A645HCW2_9ZZZZ
MRVVADALSERGYTVSAPLLSGHATSLQEMDACTAEDWLADAREAYDELVAAGCKEIFMMGLSMGGLLASILAQELPCSGLALMSTPFRIREYLRRIKRVSRVLPYIVYEENKQRYQRDSSLQSYRGVPLRKLNDLERLAIRARGGLYKIDCPVLLLQSEQDKRVDLASVPIAENGIGSKRVTAIWLKHSPHACTVGPEKALVAEYCVKFVEDILSDDNCE